MDQSTCAPSSNTSTRDSTTPLHTEVATLRPVGIPIEPLRVTPRDVPRQRTLTARPADWPTDADVDHAIGAYGPAAPYQPHDRIGQPAAWAAFGDGPGSAA